MSVQRQLIDNEELAPKMLVPGESIRSSFPIFKIRGRDKPLAYLDTAASSQKPQVVIDRLATYLSSEHANIHRGAYELSSGATELYAAARARIAKFIGAAEPAEVIFTRGTTESINLVAHAYENNFKAGDVILLTLLEHHSNIVPWQLLAKRKNLKLVFVDIDSHGQLDLADLSAKLRAHKPKLLAITALSNSIGTVVPLDEVVGLAKKAGTRILVDAAQAVVHGGLNVAALDLDFAVFSGHKMYGPTGIGVLYAKREILEAMEPFQGGGDMIESVSVEGSTWAPIPRKFEAGTPSIAEAVAFGVAVEFMELLGLDAIRKYEAKLFDFAFDLLSGEPGVTLYGPRTSGGDQASIIAFNVAGVHPHDLSTVADSANVQIRAGHHCAMPLLNRLGLPSSARASIGVYSTEEDFKSLLEAIRRAKKMFS